MPDWEEDDEEEWDEEDASPAQDGDFQAGVEQRRGFAIGLLAMLPLFLAYEYAQHAGATHRNAAEMVLLRGLEPLQPGLAAIRPLVLLVACLAALVACYRSRVALGPSLLRVALEGVVLALVLGPALTIGTRLTGTDAAVLRRLTHTGGDAPELAGMAHVFGGAAYEELLFRVLGYGLCFLLVKSVMRLCRAQDGVSRWSAELLGAIGSSVLFAAFHLEVCTGWLGLGGEAFHPAAFTWRFLAGLSFAVTFRWRGPGVAAWGHGLFNAWLLMGADPATLL